MSQVNITEKINARTLASLQLSQGKAKTSLVDEAVELTVNAKGGLMNAKGFIDCGVGVIKLRSKSTGEKSP